MPTAKKQLRILYRVFLFRAVDVSGLSGGSDTSNLLGQILAILAAFGFVLAYVLLPQYISSTLSKPRLLVAAWGDEEFLISTTMMVTGLFSSLAWTAILPETQDSVILTPLPVRLRITLLAKLAAVTSLLATFGLALNFFTGISFPFFIVPAGGDLFRTFAAYSAVMALAGAFVFCSLVSLQSVAALVLPYRVFQRCSTYVQLLAIATILSVYFLTPPLATVKGLTAPENKELLALIPSFWFLGLFQDLNGPVQPIFHSLAHRAVWSVLAAFGMAAAAYPLAYRKVLSRILTQPYIAPAVHFPFFGRAVRFVANRLFPQSLHRAVFLFTLRGLLRSGPHRLLIAVYGGIAFAVSIAYSKSFLAGIRETPWYEPNIPLLNASIVLLSLAVIGVRALFALPISLPANWVFRVTAIHLPADYFSATRRSLFVGVAVPIWICCSLFFLAIWPGLPSIEHTVVLIVLGCILIDLVLYGFRSIPFTCSYLPGGANLKVRLGIFALLIVTITSVLSGIEYWAIEKAARYLVLLAILVPAALWAAARRRAFAISSYNRLEFEKVQTPEIYALDLRPESALFGDDAYASAIDAQLSRPLWGRLKPIAALAGILLMAGFVYQRFGEWRDRRESPHIGRSFDIGGRSLNIYCSGQGAPTVILESNWGAPGFSWVYIQRQIAKFTRACWYDRAGYGWSDPGPFPNHSDAIARDLHKLLQASGNRPPFVLVGHAMGAFHIRVFRGYYPSEVAGLVFVDPMSEDLTIQIHNHVESLRPAVLFIHQLMGTIGLLRLVSRDPGPVPSGSGLSAQEWTILDTLRRQTKSLVATGKEPPLWISGELARASGNFGNAPIVVLSAGIQDQEEDPKLDHSHELKMKLHAQLASLSDHGQLTILNTGHQIPLSAPNAVVSAIRQVVGEARRNGA